MRCRCCLAFAIPICCAIAVLPAAAQDHAHAVGTVSFPTSCKPAVQSEFEKGVAMLHSYWFNYAGKTFRGVLEQDPGCAMAYWGIALDLMGNTLSSPPSAQTSRTAWDLLEKARSVDAKTERERMWLDAARAYFRNYDTVSVERRLDAYNEAMRRLAERFPEDFEAQVYYALTLQSSAPKNDTTYANQLKSAAMLERLYATNPQHPGITHYLIHAYDFAPFADKGIGAARRYAAIAPAVPHARHMPAHIYSMVGLWQDSIVSNVSALAIQPDYYHAADFTVYAHLQLAQDQQASKLIEKALATPERGDRPPTMANFTAKVAMPARYVLERADWKAAAALPIVPTEYPMADSLAHFTRGLGMARLNDRNGARKEIDAMQRLRTSLEKSGDSYWAARTGDQILAVSAWMTLADGAVDKAIAQARQSADSEEASIKHVAMENRLYPLRELLGDLLLEAKRPKEAYAEYVASLKQYPNRFRGLYGAARAAEAAGDSANARVYYRRLVDLAAHADAVRPEVQRARGYRSQR